MTGESSVGTGPAGCGKSVYVSLQTLSSVTQVLCKKYVAVLRVIVSRLEVVPFRFGCFYLYFTVPYLEL